MAIYKEDIVDVELENGTIYRSFLGHSIGSGDNQANRYGVRVFRNGQPENIGGSCAGYFIRQDGETVAIINGTVNGNMAYVTLPESCYTVEGNFTLAIKCTGGGVTGTLRIVDGVVSQTSTDVIVDPGTIIPSIDALVAAISEAMESVPTDYSAMLQTVAEINSAIGGNTSYYSTTSNTGWNDAWLTPLMKVRKGDIYQLDVTFESAPASSTYIILRQGSTDLVSYQCQGLTTKTATYTIPNDMENFHIIEGSEAYTGRVNLKLTVLNRQTQVEENRITGRELAGERHGFMSLQELSPFIVGGYDYPTFNPTNVQVSSREVMTADRPMLIQMQNGFKAIAIFIDGSTVTDTGWQERSLYIPEGSNFVLKIEKVSHGTDEKADVIEYLGGLKIIDDDDIEWHDIKEYAAKWEHSKSTEYSTGSAVSASGYFELYYYPNPQFRFVKLHASVHGRSTAEIAFYSTEDISTSGYMQAASQTAGSWDDVHYVYAEVPEGCKLMTINSRNIDANNDPFNIEIYVDDVDQYKNVELLNRNTGINAFDDYKICYHFNADRLGQSEIPSQSLADIDMAHRLGFKVFELNVHKTATAGKFVCMHGASGKIGNELVARDGTTDISNLAFGDVTAETFLNDYVYNTTVEQFRTHVTFLDEALLLCKKYGIIPQVSWADYPAIEYFEKIMGPRYLLGIYSNYYIRRANFKGTYVLYETLTAAQLEEVLEKSGAPMLYCITSDQTSLTDAQLTELAEICHKHGSLIGFAGVYQTPQMNIHLLDLGFDFFSSGWEVELFCGGNLAAARSYNTFADFETNGTVSSGVLSLANGKYMGCYPDNGATKYIAKGCLRIRFSGTLKITLGTYIYEKSFTSDGSKDLVLSSAFYKQIPGFTATASGAVTVYECAYDADVC